MSQTAQCINARPDLNIPIQDLTLNIPIVEKKMRALLIRVAADKTSDGGKWNGPVDSRTRQFVYVPICEAYQCRQGLTRYFCEMESTLYSFNCLLPDRLKKTSMHLDPDFDYLTYGDREKRGAQIESKLTEGDLLVFYAALKDTQGGTRLVYAIIGLFVIDVIRRAVSLSPNEWHTNAHSRRLLTEPATDIVVQGKPGVSGRLKRCIPVGEWRDRAYRVRKDLLDIWGGLSIKNGYLQRSINLPEFKEPERFYQWFLVQEEPLVQRNNLTL